MRGGSSAFNFSKQYQYITTQLSHENTDNTINIPNTLNTDGIRTEELVFEAT
jgi:hypothetical protein